MKKKYQVDKTNQVSSRNKKEKKEEEIEEDGGRNQRGKGERRERTFLHTT